MRRQEVPSSAMTLRPYLTSMLISRRANVEDQGSRKGSRDMTTLSGAVIRSAGDAAAAQPDQRAMVNLGPMLTLLTMLRRHSAHRDRPRWLGPTLPSGCVMVARYVSP